MPASFGEYVIPVLFLALGVFFAWRSWRAILTGVIINVFYRVRRDMQPVQFFVVTAIRVFGAVAFAVGGALNIIWIASDR